MVGLTNDTLKLKIINTINTIAIEESLVIGFTATNKNYLDDGLIDSSDPGVLHQIPYALTAEILNERSSI